MVLTDCADFLDVCHSVLHSCHLIHADAEIDTFHASCYSRGEELVALTLPAEPRIEGDAASRLIER